ncbi:MAG: hypothetical protein HY908_11775 [Myxococcales bacterium]|nr:hypothetical protein [Myxococcales bacterium]
MPAEFGEPCVVDEDCAGPDGVCFEDACSRTCEAYADCPDGTTCGAGGDRVLCVAEAPADDNAGARCINDDDACVGGNECRSRGPDDVYAYCSGGCESDRDCPAKWFCAVGLADPDHPYCQPRGFCDPCNVDDDCRTEYDDCIAGEDGLKFCSYVCDPDPSSSSCPVDTECREVPGHGYQCVPFAGGCTGDGSLCQPCRFDSDCEDGPCLYDRYAQIRLCGQDCDEDPCPVGYDCVPIEGQDKPQCYPRVLVAGRAQTQACTRPSGGGLTCDPCADFSDCESGQCIRYDTGMYCGADCTDTDCGAWEECQAFNNGAFHLCVAYNQITCGQYYRCTQNCDPETDECDAGNCR